MCYEPFDQTLRIVVHGNGHGGLHFGVVGDGDRPVLDILKKLVVLIDGKGVQPPGTLGSGQADALIRSAKNGGLSAGGETIHIPKGTRPKRRNSWGDFPHAGRVSKTPSAG